ACSGKVKVRCRAWAFLLWRPSSPVRDAPDFACAVVHYQQRTILRDGQTDRAAPDTRIARPQHPAGQKVFIAADRLAVLEADADDAVAHALTPVPGAVQRDEGIVAILFWKLLAGVEDHTQRRDMRLQQDIRHDHPRFQLRLCRHSRVVMRADIVVGPAVESALLYRGHVVRHKVIAKAVALVAGRPELARDRVKRFADSVADAAGEDTFAGAVRVELQDGGAARFLLGDVVFRTDRQIHLRACRVEDQVARPVLPVAAPRNIRHDDLRPAARLRLPDLI